MSRSTANLSRRALPHAFSAIGKRLRCIDIAIRLWKHCVTCKAYTRVNVEHIVT
jgi:hypothetical protein